MLVMWGPAFTIPTNRLMITLQSTQMTSGMTFRGVRQNSRQEGHIHGASSSPESLTGYFVLFWIKIFRPTVFRLIPGSRAIRLWDWEQRGRNNVEIYCLAATLI